MSDRIYNFSAGPATLPLEVLEIAQKEFLNFHNTGMSLIESSHRSPEYDEVHQACIKLFRKVLGLDDSFHVLFLGGGASTQFAMIPMNFLTKEKTAAYVDTGAWAGKAMKEANHFGNVHLAGSSKDSSYDHVPMQLDIPSGAAYVHLTSNNTIFGTEFKTEPEVGDIPLVCDASSDILHKKIDVNKYGIIYAGAQKNMGPAGCTLVIIRKDLLERSDDSLHTYLNYNTHVAKDSLYNTPPAYSIYIIGLVYKWLLNMGGLDKIYERNLAKANLLYNFIDQSDEYFKGTVTNKEDRSLMNVTFRMQNEELEKKFINEAQEKGFSGLKGHRSVGGLRASIYNAFPPKGVEDLVEFMKDFKSKN